MIIQYMVYRWRLLAGKAPTTEPSLAFCQHQIQNENSWYRGSNLGCSLSDVIFEIQRCLTGWDTLHGGDYKSKGPMGNPVHVPMRHYERGMTSITTTSARHYIADSQL